VKHGRIVSGVVTEPEFEDIERVKGELGIPRSELVRRALKQFIEIHEYRKYIRYIASKIPERKSDITLIDARSQGGQSFSSNENGENPGESTAEGGR